MRKLTPTELELISGGNSTYTQFETVYAVAFDSGFESFDFFYEPFEWTASDYYYGDSGGGSYSGESSPYVCETHDPTTLNNYMDQLASKIARDIIAKPDDQSREYMAFIYREGATGVVRASQLYAGDSVGVSITLPDGVAAENILGIVHNHDVGEYGGSLQMENLNRLPSWSSDPNTQTDWKTADDMVAAGASAGDLTLYLLDTKNVLREFNYYHKSLYTPSSPNKTPPPALSKDLVPDSCPL